MLAYQLAKCKPDRENAESVKAIIRDLYTRLPRAGSARFVALFLCFCKGKSSSLSMMIGGFAGTTLSGWRAGRARGRGIQYPRGLGCRGSAPGKDAVARQGQEEESRSERKDHESHEKDESDDCESGGYLEHAAAALPGQTTTGNTAGEHGIDLSERQETPSNVFFFFFFVQVRRETKKLVSEKRARRQRKQPRQRRKRFRPNRICMDKSRPTN